METTVDGGEKVTQQHTIFWVDGEETTQVFQCPSCLATRIKGPCEKEILNFLTCNVKVRKKNNWFLFFIFFFKNEES